MTLNRIEQLQAFLAQDPDDAFTRFALAREYWKEGMTQEALAFFQALVTDQPDYTGTYYHLGKLYEQLNQKEEAEAVYQQGIAIARTQRQLKDLSELQDALMQVQGIGLGDDDD